VTHLSRRLRILALAVAVVSLLALIVMRAGLGPLGRPGAKELAHAAAGRFLGRYLAADGRVVRHDQGGDTVSEGQAYAMLLTAAIGDSERFDLVWTWTRTHLQRQDGLLAWRWVEGRVADSSPASDADVDTAHALVVAAARFERPDYLEEAKRIARSVMAHETVDVGGGRPVLVAGPWARSLPYVVNPSYFAPAAFAALAAATADARWTALRESGYELTQRLTTDPPSLPPDWAEFDGSAQVRPIGSPDDRSAPPSFGFDAARLIPRLATDCAATGRELAWRSGRLLPIDGGRVVARYDIRASPLADFEHPLGYVAAAATSVAAGDGQVGRRLLRQAEEIDRKYPTYYGAAWVALGRVMLTTRLLDGCGARAA
jgi:endo-1,4-beta-D-glucanase Y